MDEPKVLVLDFDPSVREEIRGVLRAIGVNTRGWSTAGDFFADYDANEGACLIIDVDLPDMGGLEVQQTLHLRGSTLPIIMTGSGSIVSTAVAAVRNGAVDFLEKPLQPDVLVDRVRTAVRSTEMLRRAREFHETVVSRLARLSVRERDVLDALLVAMSTKQIASRLNVSPKTVDNHRASILKKLEVGSTVELLRMLLADDKLQSPPASSPRGELHSA